MKVWQSRLGGVFCIKLDRGEEVSESLRIVAQEKGIKTATVTGIGALQEVELAYFDIEGKEYHGTHLSGSWELLSLNGNLSMRGGELFPHLHALLSDRECRCRGGHLFSGVVSVTVEMFVQPFPVPVHREMDPEIGLALFSR